ncbi:DUF1289 domain-containing protein [Thalassospira profundimaris]|uniref:Prolyl-tRNA synthetase n=1 Tax=Thalassospira profundimaris TaxID=502049 RepID=A0A367X551_9PROT|nr:DUF1289 domain-containing protein [Thalassospira profundimaris]RCK48798.1 prolyl-tRNA synthetase [Thalassospira profundimaris]
MSVKSPCIGTCVLDPKSGFCLGCFRTGDEIGAWMGLSDGNKKRVISKAQSRQAQLTAASKTAMSTNS